MLTGEEREQLIYNSGKIPRIAFKVRQFHHIRVYPNIPHLVQCFCENMGLHANSFSGIQQTTVWVFLALAVLCTLARFAIRAFRRRRPSLDDYFVLLGTAALATSWASLLQELDSLYVVEALNDHPSEIVMFTPAEQPGLMSMSTWYHVFIAMLWLSIFAIKGAFLVFFYNLIRQLPLKIYIQFWIIVFFNVACWLTLSFIDWVTCPYIGAEVGKCLYMASTVSLNYYAC